MSSGNGETLRFYGAGFSAAVREKCKVLQTSLRNKCGVWKKMYPLTTTIPHSTKNEYWIKFFTA